MCGGDPVYVGENPVGTSRVLWQGRDPGTHVVLTEGLQSMPTQPGQEMFRIRPLLATALLLVHAATVCAATATGMVLLIFPLAIVVGGLLNLTLRQFGWGL